MRIAYGVHGYSRGHATRALSVVQSLARCHEVMLFAGGDGYDLIAPHFPVQRIPCLGFSYRDGRRSNWQTLVDNAPRVLDLLGFGAGARRVCRAMSEFRPDAVVSDAEPWTHLAGKRLGLPRIGFDHFGVLVHCRVSLPAIDWLKSFVDRHAYRWLMRAPDRVLVSSFFSAPPSRRGVELVGPLLRDEVKCAQARRGHHLLAYFNQGSVQMAPHVLSALRGSGREVRLYGSGRRGREGNLWFRPSGLQPFLDDLSSCHAVISTAGNQLVGEAMALAKPILAIPEATVEQRLNAREVVRMGIGEQVRHELLSANAIRGFVDRSAAYAERARLQSRDGRLAAVDVLERWLAELGAEKAVGRLREAVA